MTGDRTVRPIKPNARPQGTRRLHPHPAVRRSNLQRHDLRCTMKTQLLAWSVVLCGVSAVHAQWPAYNTGGYPAQPMFVQPTPYPAPTSSNAQPAMPRGNAPYVYYGDFPNGGAAPAQPAPPPPRPTYLPTQYAPPPGNGSVYYSYPSAPASSRPYNYYPLG